MSSLQKAVEKFSTLSKGLAAVMVAGYLLQAAVPSTKQVLGLVSGRTLPCVWNILTSGLLQDNLISLVVFVTALLFLSPIVEPLYGPREFLRLLLVSLAGSGGLTFVLVTLTYYVAALSGAGSERAGKLLYLPICGFQGGLAALLVALKQLIPDNEATVLNLVHFRVRHLAGIYVVLMAAVGLLTGSFLKLVPFTVFGAFSAWLYLRFFQVRGDGGLKGDPSEDFRFASFFPEAAQPAADAVAAACSAITRLGGGGSGGGGSAAVRGSPAPAPLPDDSDTARRRERGVRALEERLGLKAAIQPANSGPVSLAQALDDAETGKADL